MTPLAQKITNQLTMPKKHRTLQDQDGILEVFDDIHCFELSAVVPVMEILFSGIKEACVKPCRADQRIFLPAPKTWVEWRVYDNAGRKGCLLIDQGDGYAEVWCVADSPLRGTVARRTAAVPLLGVTARKGNDDPDIRYLSEIGFDDLAQITLEVYAALSLINTPRVIGRRQHMPHAGLQRKLAHAKGMAGKYPLHAWHEIVLEVTPPRVDPSATGEPHETRLTGAKALHFCRCHLRVRLGQLELVSAHWRGDPALGIKQTRYRLEPGQRASA